jgi:hypothetical protein
MRSKGEIIGKWKTRGIMRLEIFRIDSGAAADGLRAHNPVDIRGEAG